MHSLIGKITHHLHGVRWETRKTSYFLSTTGPLKTPADQLVAIYTLNNKSCPIGNEMTSCDLSIVQPKTKLRFLPFSFCLSLLQLLLHFSVSVFSVCASDGTGCPYLTESCPYVPVLFAGISSPISLQKVGAVTRHMAFISPAVSDWTVAQRPRSTN